MVGYSLFDVPHCSVCEFDVHDVSWWIIKCLSICCYVWKNQGRHWRDWSQYGSGPAAAWILCWLPMNCIIGTWQFHVLNSCYWLSLANISKWINVYHICHPSTPSDLGLHQSTAWSMKSPTNGLADHLETSRIVVDGGWVDGTGYFVNELLGGRPGDTFSCCPATT